MESLKFGSSGLCPPYPLSGSFRSRLRYSVISDPKIINFGHPFSKFNCAGMLRKSLTSSLLTFDSTAQICYCKVDLTAPASIFFQSNVSFKLPSSVTKPAWGSNVSAKKWIINSTEQIEDIITSDEDKSMWEACRVSLSAYNFSVEEMNKILGKAFGFVHSPYWGEERKKEVPKLDTVNGILEYLRSLSLSDDDLCKLLKKFPEVLGCNLEQELKTNVHILERDWGIKGKTLRNLLLRNPKVLGYNIDCKGDCMAQCTRCWVRF